jgi:ubiquitin-protein ligase
LLQDPNPEDPLNTEAAALMKSNERKFESDVTAAVNKGHYILNTYFPPTVKGR